MISPKSGWSRPAAVIGAFAAALVAAVMAFGGTAGAAIVPTAPLATAATSAAAASAQSDPGLAGAATAPGAASESTQRRANLAATGIPIGLRFAAGSIMIIVGMAALRFCRNAH